MGLIPDLANARDISVGFRQKAVFDHGFWLARCRTGNGVTLRSPIYYWRDSATIPLVLSVHSVVYWDFAMTRLPGWHSTIFAPYSFTGAIFSGCALVLTLLLSIRKAMKLENVVTIWHLDNLAKIVLFTSLIVTYSYMTEWFTVWYTHDPIELATFHERYWWLRRVTCFG